MHSQMQSPRHLRRGRRATRAAEAEAVALSPLSHSSPGETVVADQLIDAVRSRLDSLLDGWSPEQYPELVQVLDRFASDIVPGTPAMAGAKASRASLDLGQ